MSLDLLVKLSQIAVPFILMIIGYWLNKGIQTHSQNLKLVSEFNTKWSEQFIEKCREYSNSVSEIQFLIFKIGHKKHKYSEKTQRYNECLERLAEQKYHIETHSLLVDDVEQILLVVEQIWEQVSNNVNALKDGGIADFDAIKSLQRDLLKLLKSNQRSVLKL